MVVAVYIQAEVVLQKNIKKKGVELLFYNSHHVPGYEKTQCSPPFWWTQFLNGTIDNRVPVLDFLCLITHNVQLGHNCSFNVQYSCHCSLLCAFVMTLAIATGAPLFPLPLHHSNTSVSSCFSILVHQWRDTKLYRDVPLRLHPIKRLWTSLLKVGALWSYYIN
jgi:hypothetical protein